MGSFKTKARAVELLGKKQIRDSVTALAEIMKNSYDADAELLRVEFLTKGQDNPCIVVCDTGVGMDDEDLENKWLVLGTPSKKSSKKRKSPKGRALMGEKGIGRLAASKLGQQMWMFTKKKEDCWNILYANWNIFENTDLYLDDVQVPVSYADFAEEIPGIMRHLAAKQRENLRHDSWDEEKNEELYDRIWEQIDSALPDADLVMDFCDLVESHGGQGTVLFFMDLNDDWDRYLDNRISSDEDNLAYSSYNRLNAFLSDFAPGEKDFTVELFLNDKPLEFSAGFNDEDYEIYDLKIEGYVEHGIFHGTLAARHGDQQILEECNQILNEGIQVTSGISNWEDWDCGRYTLKLCHFEMDPKNSGLTKAEYDVIKKRMDRAGGIGVYRDNVRVLPYGEPENDFLGMEVRRSKSARYYLFSHRNIFGRIDITSEGNPYLEDKSSREGLLENQYYYYFIKTLQNLLIRIAVDFAGDMNKSALQLRRSYLDYNNAKHNDQEKLKTFEKEQNRLYREEKSRIQNVLKTNPKLLQELEQGISDQLEDLRQSIEPTLLTRYRQLLEQTSQINEARYKMERLINQEAKQLKIEYDKQFESRYPVTLINAAEEYNDTLRLRIETLLHQVCIQCDDMLERLNGELKRCQENFVHETGEELSNALGELEEYLLSVARSSQQQAKEVQQNILQKETVLSQSIEKLDRYTETPRRFKEQMFETVKVKYQKIQKYFEAVKQELENIDITHTSLDLQEIRRKIDRYEKESYQTAGQLLQIIEEKHIQSEELLKNLLKGMDSDDRALIDQLTVQNEHLKEQNEIYMDLANLGMSAEIVNHEFNQLFNNVYDAINQLRHQSMPEGARYYLYQINVGFRAISDRMNQLSPMYRSRGINKRVVNIRQMIEELHLFFQMRLEHEGISFTNDVLEDVELKISLSKIYPILSNLIYNSMYWVADRKDKRILVHFVEEECALYVEDSGPGISARNKEKVFKPFFTLKQNGRGLGLSISRNVLESQGHKIEVVIESEHKMLSGACLKITFNSEEGNGTEGV